MNRSRMAFALGLVVPTLSLAGCSDDPVPKVAPHESPSVVSESPSPTGPVEPTMPATAKKHTAAGAEAFVRYWFQAFSFAMRTGNTSLVHSLSMPDCASCGALIEKVAGVYRKGGSIKSGGWVVEVAVPSGPARDVRPTYLLRVRQEARTLYDAEHAVVDRTKMAKVPMRAQLVRNAGSWSLGTLEIVG